MKLFSWIRNFNCIFQRLIETISYKTKQFFSQYLLANPHFIGMKIQKFAQQISELNKQTLAATNQS